LLLIIPGLTPVGFAYFITISILVYPEEESERLGKVVRTMPIDTDRVSIDGKPERLPKEISRHLLPRREDLTSKSLLETTISRLQNNKTKRDRRPYAFTSLT